MSAAATKTTASDELAQLDRERDRTHAELQEEKRSRDAFDAETQRLKAEYGHYLDTHPEEHRDAAQNPKPDTKSAALGDEIRQRTAHNPHTDDVEAAKAEYHQAAGAVEAFRREHVEELVVEARADVDEAIAHLRRGFEQVAEGSVHYRAVMEKVKILIQATPGLGGLPGMDAYDGRVEEWAVLAKAVLEGEIFRPGLSDAARDRLERLG
jgi:hypothetical protein